MGRPTGPRTWTLFVFLSWIFVGQMVADPQYFVTVPALLEAGAETRFCLSLLQPDEPLVIKVSLKSTEKETTLLELTSSEEFHQCFTFQAPVVRGFEVLDFKVVVYGDRFDSEEVRKVMVKAFTPKTFIQTDKPFYLPGQTVHFRVISLDSMFRPTRELYRAIEIRDSHHNLLGQWLNNTSNRKILQLSFPLNSWARTGEYTIAVWIDDRRIYHNFNVHMYSLPRFDVKVKATDEVSIGQDKIPVRVCAKYTFAQSVPVSIEFQMCRPLHPDVDCITPCYTEITQTKEYGCAIFNVEMATFTKLDPQSMSDTLEIKVLAKERGTGFSWEKWKNMKLSYVVGKLLFIDTPTVYSEGSIIEGKVKVINFNNEPVPDTLVDLWIEMQQASPQQQQILTTDSHGIASFRLNTTGHDISHLRASLKPGSEQTQHSKTPHFTVAEHKLFMVPPPSPRPFSFLEVKKKEKLLSCYKEENFSISYALFGETRPAVDVMYLVLSRGNIVMQGHQKADVHRSGPEGEISFTLKITGDLTPELRLIAFTVLPNEIVIADSEKFPTEKCFSNKVSLEFSPTSAFPGKGVTLQVSADPGSLCGVSAVDQSVLIEEPGKTLDTDKIFKLLPDKTGYYADDPETCLIVERRRSKHRHRRYISDSWGFPVFKRVGLKIVTNMFTKLPTCLILKGRKYIDESKCGTRFGISSSSRADSYRTLQESLPLFRTFFPETWIWNIVDVGESGSTNLSLTVPDTITTWETEAFCLSPQGFGLAPRKELTVFQSLFLVLSLPYSIIRGEQFVLKATVFTHLSSCITVSVTPTPSSDYTLTPLPGEQYTSCLCANDQQTFNWTMSPSVLGVVNVTVSAETVASQASCDSKIVSVPERGPMDVVTRSLIVKAEGTEQTKTYNRLLCPTGGALTEEMELQLPENVIVGSARATLSVMGDILGRPLRKFDDLLKMPHGSGERNMALMASNIYILEYLKNTRQLTPAILEKTLDFLTKGYQTQLKYQHSDGAYSKFEEGEKNTWLTAFVLRSLVKASLFIFIDSSKIAESTIWLASKQQKNGCFEVSGKLLNAMKGGVSDEVTLSAYITATFLELNMSVTNPIIQNSISCLKESISYMKNTFTTALLAYVFTLAGDMGTRADLFRHLDTLAVQQGDTLHWYQREEDTSLSVEISSYVLLAKLSASPTVEDLGYCARIVKWLTGQENEYGGFGSTQDTVVALRALALYSYKVLSHEGSSTVTVQSSSSHLTFDVNPNNRLLYQEEALRDMTGKYSLEVKGAACATVQISLYYNVPITPRDSVLYMEAKSESSCQVLPPRFDLELKSVHRGLEFDTNMVIMEIKLLSGYQASSTSLRSIENYHLVDRVDHGNDLVVVYLKELPKDFLVCHLDLINEIPVQNLKPGFVKIYDLHEPSCRAELEYTDPCAADNTG